MKNRGLYNQDEGNNSRSGSEVIADIMLDNDMIEGEWERPMISAAKKGNLKEVGRLRDCMKKQAVRAGCKPDAAQERADSCLRRAMANLRL